ncbi:exo-beta-N-acetylmuramidase NamZ family protein [Prosthecochloris vibrioformis]|nr:DUF1343 domain-containing protein [Prosthecochloris vibrioformis]
MDTIRLPFVWPGLSGSVCDERFPIRWSMVLVMLCMVLFSLVVPRMMGAAEQPRFMYGIDVLDELRCSPLQRKQRVGLITNRAAVSRSGEADYRVLLRHGVDLRWLMAPEHGFEIDVAAGELVGESRLGELMVHSLYGASRRPDVELLRGVDVLLFDLQDIGTRAYTYISTLYLAMDAAREAGIRIMVLDRPNPVAPLGRGGFVLDPAVRSFVGQFEVPFLHGMTVGQLAFWLQREKFPEVLLEVVPMAGYSAGLFGDEIDGFRFVPPSPNISDVLTAVAYPATVLLEATNISEGRGTDASFLQFGAPFVDRDDLVAALERFSLPGVEFQPVKFRPTASKYEGRTCEGARLLITDWSSFRPFRTSVALLIALRDLYPDKLDLETNGSFFDKLSGTPLLRKMLLAGTSLDDILAAAARSRSTFDPTSPLDRLYR